MHINSLFNLFSIYKAFYSFFKKPYIVGFCKKMMWTKKIKEKNKLKKKRGKPAILTNEQKQRNIYQLSGSSLTKYIKFTKDVYNFDTGYPPVGIFLKEVIREVCKYLASEMFVQHCF